MNFHRVLLAAAFAAVSSVASASDDEVDYGWCEVKGADGSYLMSALLQAPKGPNDDIERAFAASMGSQERASCWFYYSSPSDADDHFGTRRHVIETQEKVSYSLTGWTGPYAITGEPAKDPPGAYLTVKKVGPTPAEAAAEQTKRELEGQRAGAAANAKRVADAARNEAAMKAQIAKFMAELKKRGRAQ